MCAIDGFGLLLSRCFFALDEAEWQRRNPTQPGLPPPGVVNAGSHLDFKSTTEPYLVFLKRASDDVYEPLSGQTFPTDSVYLLGKPGTVRG